MSRLFNEASAPGKLAEFDSEFKETRRPNDAR